MSDFVPITQRPASAFLVVGWPLVLAGIALTIWAAQTDIYVQATEDRGALVTNIDLAQRQLLLFGGGLAAIAIGVMLLCTRLIVREIVKR